jgi:hypothetical protein
MHWRKKMNKSLVALIGTLIAAATMFASSAEAGLKIKFGFGGGFPAFHSHNGGGHAHRHYQRKRYVARRVAKKTVVAKKSTPSVSKVAKADKVSKPEVVAAVPVTEEVEVIADNENSSIAGVGEPIKTSAIADPETETSDIAEADAKPTKGEAKPEKTAGKLDCKKFFPSVGMTLSVSCE